MANHTLITSLSRRAILAGGAVSVAAPAVIPPAIALPAMALPAAPPLSAGPDAALLWRVAVADRYRAAYDDADAECDRLYGILRRHPDYPETRADTPEAGALWDDLAGRIGILEADARWDRLYELCEAATRAVFDLPARTLEGARAKLRLGLAVLEAEHRGGIDPVDCTYLEGALADFDRLAAGVGAAAHPAAWRST